MISFTIALAIDPNNGAAIAHHAYRLMEDERDLEAAAKEFVKALQLDPGNVDLLFTASTFASLIGRHDEAIILMKRALELDPLCTFCMYLLSKTYMNAGLLKGNDLGATRATVGSSMIIATAPAP